MEPTQKLIDELRREEIEDARQMSISQKLAAGGDLFDAACEVMLGGILNQHRGISVESALDLLRKRLEFARRTETRL